MRVLMLTNTFPPAYTGGAEVSTYHTCRGLMRRGVHCSILVVSNRMPTTLDDWYELDGIPVHRVNFYTHWRPAWRDIFDERIFRAVRQELRHLKPDVVHIHNASGSTMAPYLACRWLGIPMVNTLHDVWLLCPNNMLMQQDYSFCDPVVNPNGCDNCFRRYDYWGAVPHRRKVLAALTSNVKYFIPPSQALIQEHIKAGYAPERMQLVRLGFAPPEVEPPEHPQVQELIEQSANYKTLVFAGGGIETKGAKVLLAALPTLLTQLPDLRVLIAGGGEERLLNPFKQYGQRVQVLGRVVFKDMRALFSAADLTLLPSIWLENSPVVIFESFQVGTPVVGTNFGGIPEFISDGETGYLFPRGDATAMAEKIIHHFSRPPLERRHMRQNCVQRIAKLNLDNHLDSLMAVYQQAMTS